MTNAMHEPVTFPVTREHPLDPPQDFTRWREDAPLRPMLFADGHVGWLATGYAASRAVLADPRFSNDVQVTHPPIPQRIRQQTLAKFPGFFLREDPPEHTRFRRLLTGQFTVRRMRLLEPRIEKITSDRLDAMEREGSPVDLVQSFALPIPSLVICELLGVPYSDHDRFQRDSSALLNLDNSIERAREAMESLLDYVRGLVARKREEPGDDLISGLIATGKLTDVEITGASVLMLVAGHETTANMLALGTYTLLRNPAQLAALRADPSLAEPAVEELLRYLTIVHLGPVRTATEDVEIEGRTIRAGQSVTVSLSAANRDPGRFGDPDSLDITRQATGHLAFGHGIHQCLGQQLARIEMRIGYPALLGRFPGLRLATPGEEVAMRSNMAIYGVHRLPVAW
ncbi:cytochrome P450 [Sphaerisporangium krabiense]|uniref:Cytochrome P450 n=1 Tax=Sphaerisporangium krabiense TaxID=763782 RepID=A0A7W8ZB42_9ACTN|nr:cytochrome P450 [Sphaerisporangium krabiense]MBB5630762.1 cytochrome P450 [Sphaerisporangium krabiense]GII65557.1 cytochrome P450 [Sphaerisporangium krabiense]